MSKKKIKDFIGGPVLKNKFRGRRMDNGNWVYGSWVRGGSLRSQIVAGTDCSDEMKIDVYTKTVGQFVGNFCGVDVWEGDIIQCKFWDGEGFDPSEKVFVVKYDGGAFFPVFLSERNYHSYDDYPCGCTNITVIGTAHDNLDIS